MAMYTLEISYYSLLVLQVYITLSGIRNRLSIYGHQRSEAGFPYMVIRDLKQALHIWSSGI